MSLHVHKYGGTSVGTAEKIQNVAKKLVDEKKATGHNLVVVVSAMSGETNRMTELAQMMQSVPSKKQMDVLLSTGEQVTIALLCMALEELGQAASSFTGGQVKIITDDSHSKARIEEIQTENIQAALDDNKIVVVAGFQGVTAEGAITTLGRGGSDTTAVALAAALKADECRIYTDVDGVYTTDPRVEPKAQRLSLIHI